MLAATTATTNVDKANGIRFGVISQHSLDSWLVNEDFQPQYGPPTCPKCGSEELESPAEDKDHYCEDCDYFFWSDEAYPDEPEGYSYKKNGYEGFLDRSGDVWLLKSPYFTWTQFCSPCAPGAGHLDNPLEEGRGVKTYCWGCDCFEGDKVPYPVYSIETGNLIWRVDDESVRRTMGMQ